MQDYCSRNSYASQLSMLHCDAIPKSTVTLDAIAGGFMSHKIPRMMYLFFPFAEKPDVYDARARTSKCFDHGVTVGEMEDESDALSRITRQGSHVAQGSNVVA